MCKEEAENNPWLAAYTRPRFERRVKDYCDTCGIETFLPTYQSWRRWSDRWKLTSLPLFPSYLFIRCAPRSQRAHRAPGLLWFVHNQAGPVWVDDRELEAIRFLETSGLEYDPMPAVTLGAEVEIVAGALRGVRGRLVEKRTRSVALLVSAIGGGVRVTLPDPSWIAAMGGGCGCVPDLAAGGRSQRSYA